MNQDQIMSEMMGLSRAITKINDKNRKSHNDFLDLDAMRKKHKALMNELQKIQRAELKEAREARRTESTENTSSGR